MPISLARLAELTYQDKLLDHITSRSAPGTSTAVLLKLTARPWCGLGPVAEGGGQMSAVPEKGETVMVWPSSTGRLSLYPPSGNIT